MVLKLPAGQTGDGARFKSRLPLQPLNGLLDFPAADAPGADEQASRGAVHERPDGLQVWTEDALGAVVGVADVVADRSRLPADFTCPGHGGSP